MLSVCVKCTDDWRTAWICKAVPWWHDANLGRHRRFTGDVEQNINITFKKELQKGTYRILVELYDEFGELRTSDYVNFIVD